MSTSQSRLRSVASALVQVASLPPALAHELTHMLLALPFADSVALVLEDDGDAGLRVDWDDDAPTWGIWLAYRGPLLLGAAVGLAGLIQVATHGIPENPNQQLLAGGIAAWWVIYVAPSADDRDTSDAPR